MFKRDRIAAVVPALVLSLAAITQATAKQTVEVAFVLDTTGSMRPLIDGTKVTGDGDLVADCAAGRAKLDQIKDDELPPALRDMPKPERGVALEQQSNVRK